MSSLELFGLSIVFSLVAWGVVTAWYIWPQLRGQSQVDAARPLLLLHCSEFVGLSFLVPGVVSPDLPAAWAHPAAYGDLIAALLALLALAGTQKQVGNRPSLGVQPLGLSGSSLRILSWQPCWARPGSAGCRLLHSDRARAAAPHHARAVVPPPLAGRRCRRSTW